MPASWDYEADVVILGASGAGLICAAQLAQGGKSVIVAEKSGVVGGTARVTVCIQTYGANPVQGMDYGVFGSPYHDQDVVDYYMERTEYTADVELVRNIAVANREMVNWWMDNGATMKRMSEDGWWITWGGPEDLAVQYANTPLFEFEREICEKSGVQFMFQTEATALVMDGDACVGFQATDAEGRTVYFKGKEAVVLAADGFQRNPKMLKAYAGLGGACGCSTALGTGRVIRMGQGVGANMSGLGSWSGNDSRLVPDGVTDDELLPLCRGLGFVNNAAKMPWFKIDKNGQRFAYITNERLNKVTGFIGDTSEPYHYGAAQECARGGAYWIFDSNWREYNEMWLGSANESDFMSGTSSIDMGGRYPHTPDPELDDPWGIGDPDRDFEMCLQDGSIKQADSIEELASLMNLDADKVVSAVKNWNAICEKGEDDPAYGYNSAWLFPVNEPPYYIARLTPAPYATLAGLKVTPRNQVVDMDDNPITGLYAAFMVAGGLAGENATRCAMGDQVGSMHASGVNIAKAILGKEIVTI